LEYSVATKNNMVG